MIMNTKRSWHVLFFAAAVVVSLHPATASAQSKGSTAIEHLQARFPGVEVSVSEDGVTTISGRPMSSARLSSETRFLSRMPMSNRSMSAFWRTCRPHTTSPPLTRSGRRAIPSRCEAGRFTCTFRTAWPGPSSRTLISILNSLQRARFETGGRC